jgi:hypothetical protein
MQMGRCGRQVTQNDVSKAIRPACFGIGTCGIAEMDQTEPLARSKRLLRAAKTHACSGDGGSEV